MKVIDYDVTFVVTVNAHAGPDAEVPFMVRNITDEEVNGVRQRLSALAEELNAEYPTLEVSVQEERTA